MSLAPAALVLVIASTALAADPPVPMILGHHGRLLDGSDQPVNGQLEMTFSIFDTSAPTVTQPLWTDTMQVTVVGGLYAVVLGDTSRGGTAIDPSLFAHPTLYLSVSVGSVELLPRLQVPSAPYALRAAVAAQAESVVDGSIGTASLADNSVTLQKLALTNGKFVGLDADTLDGLDSSAFAPADIETTVDAIKTSTDGLAAMKTELDGVKTSTDQIGALATTASGLATADAVGQLQASLNAIKTNTDGIPNLATSSAVAAIKVETDGIPNLAKSTDLSPLAKTTDLSGLARTTDLSGLAKTSDLSGLAKTTDLSGLAKTTDLSGVATTSDLSGLATTSDIQTLSANVNKLLALLEMLAPTSCPSGMLLFGGAGNKGAFCIDKYVTGYGQADYATAVATCVNRGLHLCTYDEWTAACPQVNNYGVDGWQWVAGGINGAATGSGGNGLRPMLGGSAQCWNSGWGWAGFGNHSAGNFRCCR